MMRNPRQKMYDAVRMLDRVRKINIDKHLKSRIIRTWWKVFFLDNSKSNKKAAKIAGFDVEYLNYERLAYLYNEIFIDNHYCFTSEHKNPLIIDCGSNIGMSVLYFKMLYPDSQILAFEPGEEAFSCLEENIRKNNFADSVKSYKIALSDKAGTIDFYYDPDDPGSLRMSTKAERKLKNKRSVESDRLSNYVNESVDFLKIDVEGCELEVIEDLSNTGKLRSIKQMIMEYHHHLSRETDVMSKILRILENSGFGYQIESALERPLHRKQFQDILIFAYQKQGTA